MLLLTVSIQAALQTEAWLLFLSGDELEYLRPNIYRNVARQLNIPVASEGVVSDAFLAVAADIFSTGRSPSKTKNWSCCTVVQVRATRADVHTGSSFSDFKMFF